MINPEYVQDAKNSLKENWGETIATQVIKTCEQHMPFEMAWNDFSSHCVACGGNWGGMLLSGIRDLWPEVWEAIPDDMGIFPFQSICYVLIICGVNFE